MPSPDTLTSLRTDIDQSLDLIEILLENATSNAERVQLDNVSEALTAIATQIDDDELTSRSAAITALAKQLGSSASDLDAIHQQAVNLQNSFKIAQQLLNAFGNIVSAVQGKKPATAASIASAPAGTAATPAPSGSATSPTPSPAAMSGSLTSDALTGAPLAPDETFQPAAPPEPQRPFGKLVGARSGAPGVIGCLVLLATFAINVHWAPTQLLGTWLVTLATVAVSLALFGVAAGRWEATFIDNRNRMSLSKLQVILWTVAIFSALLSASCFNANAADPSAVMGIAVDPKLWGLLGISITAAVGAPLALSGKTSRTPDMSEMKDTKNNLLALTGVRPENIRADGHVLTKLNQADARWSDLVRGDDIGNGDTIDFSKVQHLYFTLLTLLIFGLAVAEEFSKAQGTITGLPVPNAGFMGLLAASGAGYLAYKGLSHSKDGP